MYSAALELKVFLLALQSGLSDMNSSLHFFLYSTRAFSAVSLHSALFLLRTSVLAFFSMRKASCDSWSSPFSFWELVEWEPWLESPSFVVLIVSAKATSIPVAVQVCFLFYSWFSISICDLTNQNSKCKLKTNFIWDRFNIEMGNYDEVLRKLRLKNISRISRLRLTEPYGLRL